MAMVVMAKWTATTYLSTTGAPDMSTPPAHTRSSLLLCAKHSPTFRAADEIQNANRDHHESWFLCPALMGGIGVVATVLCVLRGSACFLPTIRGGLGVCHGMRLVDHLPLALHGLWYHGPSLGSNRAVTAWRHAASVLSGSQSWLDPGEP